MKRRGLWAAIGAFANSPQGRQLIRQARDYASRPETRQQAQQLWQQVKARRPGGAAADSSTTPPTTSTTVDPTRASTVTVDSITLDRDTVDSSAQRPTS